MSKQVTGQVMLEPDSEEVLEETDPGTKASVRVDFQPQDVEVGRLREVVSSDEEGTSVILQRRGGKGMLTVDYTVYMTN